MCTCKSKKGFSLIELMVVIAIIGILAAVAVPSYQKYVYKSKTAELLVALTAAQSSVSAYLLETGVTTTNGACTDFQLSVAATNIVASGVINNNCNVTITSEADPFGGTAQVILGAPSLSTAGIVWDCTSDSAYVMDSNCISSAQRNALVLARVKTSINELATTMRDAITNYIQSTGDITCANFVAPPEIPTTAGGSPNSTGDIAQNEFSVGTGLQGYGGPAAGSCQFVIVTQSLPQFDGTVAIRYFANPSPDGSEVPFGAVVIPGGNYPEYVNVGPIGSKPYYNGDDGIFTPVTW